MTPVEYRHPNIDDVETITDILNLNAREIPLHQDETVEEILEFTFKEDDYDPRGFLLAIADGRPVGYGGSHVRKHRIEMGKNDARITIAVVPEYRGMGIEQRLMEFGLNYLGSRKIGTAKRWAYGLKGWWHDVSLEYGFRDVRHSYRMIWKHDKTPEVVLPPEGVTLEHVMFKEASDDIVSLFVDNFNTSFVDHYDFSRVLVKDIIKWRELDRENTRLTFAKKGDEIAGILMCEESQIYNKKNNTRNGWANILGVNPQFRNGGIGRALLSNGMRWLWDQGMDTIYLGMDAENSKALGLYTSLGFEIHKESINYSLEL